MKGPLLARTWTSEEDAYLLNHFKSDNLELLSKVLDRTESAIKIRFDKIKDEPSQDELDYFMARANRVTPKRLYKKQKGVIENTTKLSKWSGKGNPYAHTKSGYRPDLGISVRSGWEANVLRILKSYDIKYEFEPKIFVYPIKRGNKAYTPDIFLPDTGEEWIEVKGYLDKNSEIKLKRFKRYYPEEFSRLTMIIGASNKTREFCKELEVPTVLEYPKLSKMFKSKIKNWEGK